MACRILYNVATVYLPSQSLLFLPHTSDWPFFSVLNLPCSFWAFTHVFSLCLKHFYPPLCLDNSYPILRFQLRCHFVLKAFSEPLVLSQIPLYVPPCAYSTLNLSHFIVCLRSLALKDRESIKVLKKWPPELREWLQKQTRKRAIREAFRMTPVFQAWVIEGHHCHRGVLILSCTYMMGVQLHYGLLPTPTPSPGGSCSCNRQCPAQWQQPSAEATSEQPRNTWRFMFPSQPSRNGDKRPLTRCLSLLFFWGTIWETSPHPSPFGAPARSSPQWQPVQ